MKAPPLENASSGAAITAALQRRITPDQLAATLAEALSATSISRSGAIEPDTKSRLSAAQLILAYLVGRPVERQEIVSVNLDSKAAFGLRERLRHSPALRDALKGALIEAENGE